MKQNIIFLTLDSCRSDKFYGKNKTSITPNIDKLIEKGVYFEQMISSADSTLLAITSLFTGKHPFKTGIRSQRFNKLKEGVSTFFKILSNNGYHHYAYNPTVTKTIGLMPDFENKDSHYDYHFDLNDGLGEKVIEKLKSELSEPWCFYIHANDLHFPIKVPKKFSDNKYGDSNFEKQLSGIDSWIGKIFKNINIKNTLFIITSDHGTFIPSITIENEIINFEIEGKKQQLISKISKKTPSFLQPLKTKIFLKKEKKERNSMKKKILKMDLKPHQKRELLWQRSDLDKVLFDSNVKVPLLIVGNQIKENVIISQQVRHVDVFPTILDIIGIKNSEGVDGQSLVPLINGEELEELPAYIESTPSIQTKSNEVIGIRTSQFKYFRDREDKTKRIHLYNLKNDLDEEHNISENKDIIKKMENIIDELYKESIEDEEFSEEETKAIEEELKKLGYD
jgi:arylsulfatase A-like enzyme